MATIPLETPLSELPFITPRVKDGLARLGLETVRDLLWHFPFRYEDFSEKYAIEDLEPGQQATISGVVEEIETRRTWKKHMVITEAYIADETGNIKALWFNQPYLKNVLRPGRNVNLSGKVGVSDGEVYLSNPSYELVDGDEETFTATHTGRLVPIYPETRGLTSKGIRAAIAPLLQNCEDIPEWIPQDTLAHMELPDTMQALSSIHFPDDTTAATAARRRFAFEDLYLLQIAMQQQKKRLAKEKAYTVDLDTNLAKELIAALPFTLTASQESSLWEVLKDMSRGFPMNRLLQGDVGSGKTIVAFLSAIAACRAGLQAAIMAPTEILARQHYENLKKLAITCANGSPLSAHHLPFGFISGNETRIFYDTDLESSVPRARFKEKAESGELKIVIGTHALIGATPSDTEKKKKTGGVDFRSLGLVVIDEQHRFGVRQRQAILSGNSSAGKDRHIPHLLSMSATPIPRTVMLSVFADLDVSTITELPAGRKEIITKVVDPDNRSKAYGFIKGALLKGRQAFVVCPRIDPDTKQDSGELEIGGDIEEKSATEEYEKLSKRIFPEFKVALLHGKMSSKEKDSVMADFRSGKTHILVSTSVVEVGVDVPNATIMMIEGADKFGLAQMYQFRGRVGRGEHQSFCFLFTDSVSEETGARLGAIIEAKNGFDLAERDLELRGPGEFLGERQTGIPDSLMRGIQNIRFIKACRDAALKTLEIDPRLAQYPLLKTRVAEFAKKLHRE